MTIDELPDETLDALGAWRCDWFPDHAFYVASVYHEWFMVDNRADGAPS